MHLKLHAPDCVLMLFPGCAQGSATFAVGCKVQPAGDPEQDA